MRLSDQINKGQIKKEKALNVINNTEPFFKWYRREDLNPCADT